MNELKRFFRMLFRPQREIARTPSFNISVFNVGDKIMRVEKSATNDGSFFGEPAIFKGVKNNQIKIRLVDNKFIDKIVELDLTNYQFGWKLYN